MGQKSDQGYQLRKEIDNLLFEVSKLKEEKAALASRGQVPRSPTASAEKDPTVRSGSLVPGPMWPRASSAPGPT